MVAVDNNITNFSVDILNVVPIIEFKAENSRVDSALLSLRRYLMELKGVVDVRAKIKEDIGNFLACVC